MKGSDEKNAELEKRLEITGRSNVANDAQLKLLQDDVNMLRSKLETRNQLIESKEKSIKMLEKDIDMLRTQLHESGQGMHVSLLILPFPPIVPIFRRKTTETLNSKSELISWRRCWGSEK